MNPVTQIKAYFDALDRYDKEEANREEILRTAWLIGKEAYAYSRAANKSIKEVAREANAVQRVLDKHVRAYKLYPKGCAARVGKGQVSWSHYMAVLYVSGKEARGFYLRVAADEGWSSHELRRRVRYKYYENWLAAQTGGKRKPALRAIPQTLYTYAAEVVRVQDGDTCELDIDVGFHLKMRHTVRLRGIDCPEKGTEKGDEAAAFVQNLLMGSGTNSAFSVMVKQKTPGVIASEAKQSFVNNSPALVEGPVGGVTGHLPDTPSLRAPEGRGNLKSPALVEGARGGGAGELVVIRTYKSGKFGRFIVDLWYLPGETDKEKILKEGLLLNQVLLDKGLAEKVE